MGPESNIRSKSEIIMENKCQETTESSSSFDDDVSERESDPAFSDDEVVSGFRDYALSDGPGEVFMNRKKQLTAHWKTYIQPLRWRCKWVELRMRQLNRLERKYTRELAKYDQNELQKVDDVELQKVDDGEPNICSRKVSLSGGHRLDKVLTRKRRKRIEDTEDIGTYMSKHNLFSYYVKDNKKVPAEKGKNIGINFDDESRPDEESVFVKPRDDDEITEQELRKLFTTKEKVSELKIRLDKVMSAIDGKLSGADPKNSLVPCNALTNSSKDPASPVNNWDCMALGSSGNASWPMSKCNMDDVHLPETASMNPGEASPVPDIFRSVGDDVLIYDDEVFDGMNDFEDFNIQLAESQCLGTDVPRVSEESEMLSDKEPAPKLHSIAELTASNIQKNQTGPDPWCFL